MAQDRITDHISLKPLNDNNEYIISSKTKKGEIIYEGEVDNKNQPHGYGELYIDSNKTEKEEKEYLYKGYWNHGDVPTVSFKETGYFTLIFSTFYMMLSILLSFILDFVPPLEILLDTTFATGICAGLVRQISMKGYVSTKSEFIVFQRLLKFLAKKASKKISLQKEHQLNIKNDVNIAHNLNLHANIQSGKGPESKVQ